VPDSRGAGSGIVRRQKAGVAEVGGPALCRQVARGHRPGGADAVAVVVPTPPPTGCGGRTGQHISDLDTVVGEHAQPAPRFGAGVAREQGAVQASIDGCRAAETSGLRAVGRAADARFDQLAPAGLGQPAQQRSENAADLIVMHFQLTLDEAARRGRSRRPLRRHGSQKDRAILGPTYRDRPGGSASRGLVYGLLISLLLWAGIALAMSGPYQGW
jgi:hypothetical protein